MTRYKAIRYFDTTARTTVKIESLHRQVDDASTVAMMAEAKYNSFVEKAATFASLYQEAEADLQEAEACYKMFLQIKSDLNALTSTANEANMVAMVTFYQLKQLISAWEEVVTETLKAAEAITLSANYIQKRKASNPLISNDLVNDATAASKAAQKTVTLVLKAFKDVLSSLSSSSQASNSTRLTNVYIAEATAALLEKDVKKELEEYRGEGSILVKVAIEIQQVINSKNTLEYSLDSALKTAKAKAKLALIASEAANKERQNAKEELEKAKAGLASCEAALVAAETAVAGCMVK